MKIKFFHDGRFSPSSYIGGKTTEINENIDREEFSFPVLTQYVKEDLKYTEIGGFYVKGQAGEWELVVSDDNVTNFTSRFNDREELEFYIDNKVDLSILPVWEFQPHVKIRPRSNIFKVTKKLQPKCNFVMLQRLKAQEAIKKKPGIKLTAKKRIFEPQDNIASKDEVEKMDVEDEVVPYEKVRAVKIAVNKERLASLNLRNLSDGLNVCGKTSGKDKVPNIEDSEDYYPSIESRHDSEDDVSDTTSKRKKLLAENGQSRRTTRSQSSYSVASHMDVEKHLSVDVAKSKAPPKPAAKKVMNRRSDSVPTAKDMEVEISKQNEYTKVDAGKQVPPSSLASNTRLQKRRIKHPSVNLTGNDAVDFNVTKRKRNTIGSMAKFLAMRDQQNKDATEAKSSRSKVRGETRMDDVYTRKFGDRKHIRLNDEFQPVSAKPKLISRFSKFLGTIARNYISHTYIDWHKVPDKDNYWEFVKEKYDIAEEGKLWALRTIREAWKLYKSRVKKEHYIPYDDDEDRIKNKPTKISLDEFKELIAYWRNSKVKKLQKENGV